MRKFRFTIMEYRGGVHVDTLYRDTMPAVESRVRKDISLGYCETATILNMNGEVVATLPKTRRAPIRRR